MSFTCLFYMSTGEKSLYQDIKKMAQYVTSLVVRHPHNYYKTAGGQCIWLISNSVLTH